MWVWVFLCLCVIMAAKCGHPTIAAMCVLFVDKCAGRVLLHVSGLDQTCREVVEHTGVAMCLTDGEPLKAAQSNH